MDSPTTPTENVVGVGLSYLIHADPERWLLTVLRKETSDYKAREPLQLVKGPPHWLARSLALPGHKTDFDCKINDLEKQPPVAKSLMHKGFFRNMPR